MKKKSIIFFSLLLCVCLALCPLLSASAASGLNEWEMEILAQLDREIVISSKTIKPLVKLKNAAEIYLNRDGVDMDKASAKAVQAAVETILSYDSVGFQSHLYQNESLDLAQLGDADQKYIISAAVKAVNACGIVLSFDADTMQWFLNDNDGKLIFKNSEVIKATGVQPLALVAFCVFAFGSVLLVCARARRWRVEK